MSFATSMLAMSILMAGPSPEPPSAPEALMVSEFRLLEMNGLDWRAKLQPHLERITSQGSATVWTTTHEHALKVVQAASHTLQAPKVTAQSDSPAMISTGTHRTYVAHLKAAPAGEGNPVLGIQPVFESLKDGLSVQVSGRTIDQGTLLRVTLDETHLIAMHTVAGPATQAECCAEESKPGVGACQVPEVVRCQVNGEWLVPPNGALVISLGAHTVKGANDKAVVQERVVVIETKAFVAPRIVTVRSRKPVVPDFVMPEFYDAGLGRVMFPYAETPFAQPKPTVPPIAPPALPQLPSRTLPFGTTADGKPLQPNVPDDAIEITSSDSNGETRATPQSHPRKPADVNLVDKPEPKGSAIIGIGTATYGGQTAPRTKTTTLTAVDSKPDAVRVELTISAIPLGPAKGQLQLRLTPEGRINAEFQMSSARPTAPDRDPEIKKTSAEGTASPCCSASASKAGCCEKK